jgi:acetoin utilization deacetylase AcuC-like enzyme
MPHMLDMPFVWSDACLLHDPKGEVWVGVMTPGTEVPERIEAIREALLAGGASEVAAVSHDNRVLAAVHDRGLLHFLEHGYREWAAGPYLDAVGQDRVVPYVFPTEAMVPGMTLRDPVAIHGRAGRYAYDTMTLVGPGTWPAARAAVDATLTAVDLVHQGSPVAYAACRPPGHHVTRAGYGGSCYLNNAAVAAEALLAKGHRSVAVIDIDAHHGNGTQMVFYERPEIFYGSVHVDPGAGWFPHYVGYADERGRAAGDGANLNVPLAPGTGDSEWLEGLDQVVGEASRQGATALVVSLGVDAAADDPESPLQITEAGYRRAGEMLSTMRLPTVAVQEGGYHLETIGSLVRSTLEGLTRR